MRGDLLKGLAGKVGTGTSRGLMAINKSKNQRGMTLLELLFVVLLLSLVTAIIFTQVNRVQLTSTAEQTKVDMFQTAREAMEQMDRDLHQSGFPNNKIYQVARPANDPQFAAGITAIQTAGFATVFPPLLTFEGDVDGSGQVQVISYQAVNADANFPNARCPCLERSQIPKTVAGGVPQWQIVVENLAPLSNPPQPTDGLYFEFRDSKSRLMCSLTTACVGAASTVSNVRINLNVLSQGVDTAVASTTAAPPRATASMTSTVTLVN